MSIVLAAALLMGAPALQTGPAPAAAPRAGGLGGLLSGGLPNMGGATAGNAAGLLGYCLKNNLLGGADASSVLGSLAGRKGVIASPDYTAGQQGTLKAGDSQLSLDSLRGQVKTRVCSLVLSRARSFL